MTVQITNANFNEVLKREKLLVVDFWAEWCGPCRMIAPIIEEFSKEYEGRITMAKCNVDTSNDLPMKYAIRNIPTLLFFKDGELVDRHVGALGKSQLKEKLEAFAG